MPRNIQTVTVRGQPCHLGPVLLWHKLCSLFASHCTLLFRDFLIICFISFHFVLLCFVLFHFGFCFCFVFYVDKKLVSFSDFCMFHYLSKAKLFLLALFCCCCRDYVCVLDNCICTSKKKTCCVLTQTRYFEVMRVIV